MASTSVTTIGGVVVVTQVIPKNEASIPLQNAGRTTTPAPPPPTKTPPSPVKMDDMTTTFMRGQPHALGVVQIIIGLLCILFSLTAACSWGMIAYSPFALGAIFVVSGSVSVAAGRQTSITLVWGSLVSNIVSVLIGLAGVSYTCWLLVECPPSYRFCDYRSFSQFAETEHLRSRCSQKLWMLDIVLYGIISLFLVLLVLQTCVTIVVCVFSAKAIRLHKPCVMVDHDDRRGLLTAAALEHNSDDALLDVSS